MTQTLEDKIALVTGSGRGLGRAYALRLARQGAHVVINDVDLKSANLYSEELTAESVTDEIRNLGRRSLGIEADASDREQVESMFGEIVREFGRLDILVNNAGGALVPPGNPSDDELYEFVMKINMTSALYCCRAASELMKPQGSGKIVNVSSIAGLRSLGAGDFRTVPYSIAKAGIAQFTRALAAQLGPYGITVNSIAPAYILSSRKKAEGMAEAIDTDGIPLRRLGTPEDCARVVEFLCSDLSDYVTGQCISVCGGVTI